MNETQPRALLALLQNRTSEEDVLRVFPVDPRVDKEYVQKELDAAFADRDAERVEYALLLGFRFGLSPTWAPSLCRILDEPWHRVHENVALALQRLRDPRTVDCLYRAALAEYEYRDYAESQSLAVQCIWALFAIRSPAAREKLEALAKSSDPIIRDNAVQRLRAFDN